MFDAYDHGESIYNIIPPQEVKLEKPPMHRSKHSGTVPPSASTFGQAQTSHPIQTNLAGDAPSKVVPNRNGRTFGKAPGLSKNKSTEFLKKNTKAEPVKTLKEVKVQNPELLAPSQLKPKLKPDVTKASDAPVMNLVSSKNFIVANAVETILAAPKKVATEAKDYLRKEDYGKVPKYLQHIKSDIQDEFDYIMRMQEQEEEFQRSQVRPMDDNERQHLIEGLKARWEKVNTEYQGTTHITKLDTMGKIKRKEKWEAELSQIERDIERMSKKNIIVDQTA